MLEARGIDVTIGGVRLLDAVDAHIAPGEFVVVIGPNGAGKSTLFRALSGDLRPTAGAVTLDGRALPAWNRRELARRRTILPQNPGLSFGFTAAEVVLMGRAPHVRRTESPRDHAIADAAMRLAEVAHLAERTVTTLSGGEQQRVHFARVLSQILEPGTGAQGARYLLLDEPTSNLDLAHQHATLRIARRLSREGIGAGAVLHDFNLAAMYADRIVVLRDGRVAADGPADSVFTPTLFDEVFGVPVLIQRHPRSGCPVVLAQA